MGPKYTENNACELFFEKVYCNDPHISLVYMACLLLLARVTGQLRLDEISGQ